MIGHQDKRITPEIIPPPVSFQACEICVEIRRIMKESGAAVAADNDVIEGAGEFHARFASHRGTLQEIAHINQYSCLTPLFFKRRLLQAGLTGHPDKISFSS
jgi:hypothetical protein